MSDRDTYSGIAALTICEALLLALNDAEIIGVLKDAAATLANAGGSDGELVTNKGVAALINHIIAGGNSVRRP